jgi:hypothetical protein
MTVNELYDWFRSHFAYYRNPKVLGWKNSIRHNLALNKMFMRLGDPAAEGKSGYWTLCPNPTSRSSRKVSESKRQSKASSDIRKIRASQSSPALLEKISKKKNSLVATPNGPLAKKSSTKLSMPSSMELALPVTSLDLDLTFLDSPTSVSSTQSFEYDCYSPSDCSSPSSMMSFEEFERSVAECLSLGINIPDETADTVCRTSAFMFPSPDSIFDL